MSHGTFTPRLLFFFFSTFITATFSIAGGGSGSIAGQVADSKGNALVGATIRLWEATEQDAKAVVESDSAGTFQFASLTPGWYVLLAEKPGFTDISTEILVGGSGPEQLQITLIADSQLTLKERIMVIGDPAQLSTIPGSADYIDKLQMERAKNDFGDIHQILRQVPGVNVQEEDGYGLRPNIGLRGSGVERSSKITLMEDGVLIAPAPYSAPAAYYFPTPGRMEAVEIRKGSSQIKYGPQTQGGALNLVSTSIPDDLRLSGDLAGGQFGTFKFHLAAGDSRERIGWMVETYQMTSDGFKQLDGGGPTGFELGDYLAKLRFNSGQDSEIYQELELKFGYTDQESDETYVGLTDEDFRLTPHRRYRGSANDFFTGTHRQIQGRYFVALTPSLDLTTVVYRNDFRRNWYKLQSVAGASINDIFDDPQEFHRELGIIRGSDSLPGELRIRANNRTYSSQGVQTVLGLQASGGELHHQFEFGFRYHEDQEDRFQHEDGFQMRNQDLFLTSPGTPGSQSNRIGSASAAALFFQDTVNWGRLNITPGLRYEHIDLTRRDYARGDADRAAPTNTRGNTLNVLIPGIGASFEISPSLTAFGGLHRGFSPPGPGSDEETDAETGINYEAGLRFNRRRTTFSLVGFFNDYQNLLGADTLSSGGTGEGNLYNGGRARVSGLEASAAYDLGVAGGLSLSIPVQAAYTYTHGVFLSDFESDFESWGSVRFGDNIPYLPKHQLFAAVGLERLNWRLHFETVFSGRVRTKAGQGPYDPKESTEDQVVLNLSGEYRLPKLTSDRRNVALFLSLRNLLDDAFIVSRHPAGVRPGLPRTLLAGIRFDFGY